VNSHVLAAMCPDCRLPGVDAGVGGTWWWCRHCDAMWDELVGDPPVLVADRRRRAVPDELVPRSDRELWLRCCHGLEPAEALDSRDREDLVAELVARGWTDVQIAGHTRMSTYTTTRIRERLQLPANRHEPRQWEVA